MHYLFSHYHDCALEAKVLILSYRIEQFISGHVYICVYAHGLLQMYIKT
jgi:hypothetical protein